MKKFVKIAIATFVAVLSTSCMYQMGPSGSAGSHTVRRESPKVRSASEVFGNQPMNPTSDAVSSTWGATMGSEYWWNDARKGDRALLQKASPNEPVLVSRSTGHVWRAGCFNRVATAEPYTEEVVADQGGGGGTMYGPSFAFVPTFNVSLNASGQGPRFGGVRMRSQSRYCPPRQMYRPQPRYCAPRPIVRPHSVCISRPMCPPGTYPVRRYR
jgi:hypothetical protein